MEHKKALLYKKPSIRTVCMLLCIMLFLCGCGASKPRAEAEPTDPPQDAIASVREWLEKDFSFELSYEYMNLAVNGMSQDTTQITAADGSWYFRNMRKTWDHRYDYEYSEGASFYYIYQDSRLVCYSCIDGDAPVRMVLSEQEIAELEESKAIVVGVPGLLPSYAQDFSVIQTDNAAKITFRLPTEAVLADNSLLSVFVNNAFTMAESEYKPEYNTMILCTFELDPLTFQPRSLSYDLTELKPYILCNGAQEGEWALDMDFVTMVYTFDYELKDTTILPKDWMSTSSLIF